MQLIRANAFRGAFLVLLSAVIATCGNATAQDESPVRVRINIVGITPDTESLMINVDLDDKPHEKSPYTYSNSNSLLWVELPPQTITRLSVGISALNGGCKIAKGKSDAALKGENYYEMSITLTLLPNKLCTLTIDKHGAGRVTSLQPGIDCGETCSADYQYGSSITITAIPEIPTFPPLLPSSCRGTSSGCAIAILGPTTLSVSFTPKVCTDTKWCWENPTPQGNTLRSVWVAPDQKVFAVGDSGTSIQGNGVGWLSLPTGLTARLYDVWGFTSNDVWVVGAQGTAIHWDGIRWSTPSSTLVNDILYSIWGSAPNDVWAVGENGSIIHYDGSNWASTPFGSNKLIDIWGSSKNDIWAVSSDGSLIRFNGTTWNNVSTGITDSYFSIWGTGPNDVLVSGKRSVYRWNGSQWNTIDTSIAQYSVTALWGTGANNIYAVADNSKILRWQGTSWTVVASSTQGSYNKLRGSGPSNVWAVSDGGVIDHWNGIQWLRDGGDITLDPPSALPKSGCGAGPDDAWLVGTKGSVFRWNGVLLQRFPAVPTTEDLRAVWCAAPSVPGKPTDAVWAVGDNGTVILWNGSEWTKVQGTGTAALNAVTGSSPTDVWIAGDAGTLLHWDGARLNRISTPSMTKYDLIAMQGSKVLLAAKSSVFVESYDGAWKTLPNTAPCAIQSLAVTGNTIFIGGSDSGRMSPGCIDRYDGTNWLYEYPTPTMTTSLMTRGSNDLWAVSVDTMVRWDGIGWSVVDHRIGSRLGTLFSSGPSDVFVIGQTGSVLHWKQ